MISRLGVLAFAALAFASAPALAEAPACGGVDLVAKVRAERPEAYAAFERDARAVPNAEGLLWRIEAEGAAAPSYLFGTMHTTEKDLVALSEPARHALGAAKTVVVEVANATGAATQAEVISYVTANGVDFSGGGLEGLDEAQRAEVGRRIAASGLPASLAASLKPWFLGVTLQVAPCETKRIADGMRTIDLQVETLGRDAGAEIVGLESVTEQLDAVAKTPDETARRMIRDLLASQTASEDLRATTLQLYRDRRIGWYLAMKGETFGRALDVTAYSEFMETLVDRRNAVMAERSQPHIAAGGAFVAVGALHLPGPKGLVELYRQAGFTVTRVW
ncbi:TraB/GumN family protein [Methylopila henanensis]|uniref:TraB/GumN family protein n=1 Tax=Methylopila henanensis TaxID=873516 RepID=A0ABW4K9L9_9HYPH